MSARGVRLGTGFGVGLADGVADEDAATTTDEDDMTGLVEADVVWFELQPLTNPTIPNTTAAVESFMLFIASCPIAWPEQIPQASRQTRMVAIT